MIVRQFTKIGFGFIACAGILFLLPLHLLGQTTYEVPASVVAAGGGRGSSSSYRLISIVGEAAPDGISSDTDYEVGSGFVHMYDLFLGEEFEIGDVNGDDVIDLLDLLTVVNHILGTDPLTGGALDRADCNGDDTINLLDLISSVNVILGIWPECPGSPRKPRMTPEVWDFLRSLRAYLSVEDYARLMALVKSELGLPTEFHLSQNYPNPFNLQTIIKYQLPEESWVNLRIYNIQGQEVRALIDEQQEIGYHTVPWDGRDDRGFEVATGVYFYHIQAGTSTRTMKMVLLK